VELVRRFLRSFVAVGAASLVTASALPVHAIVADAPMRTWETNGRVTAILRVGDTVYIGGQFTQIDDRNGRVLQRNHVAAFHATTGAPTTWKPNANGTVSALAVSPDHTKIFAGGYFTRIGGGKHSHIAALDRAAGKDVPGWRASANARVKALQVSGSLLILGGSFSGIGGRTRRAIGAVSVSNGSLRSWYPGGADGEIRSMSVVGGRLVAVGMFENIGGHHEPYVAGINIRSASVYGWNSHPSQFGIAVTSDGTNVYVGTKDNHVIRYSPVSGNRSWSAHGDGNVQAVATLHGIAYVGGHFTELDGVPAPHLAAFGAGNGNRISWNANANSNLGVFAMEAAGHYLYIGGDFTRVNGRPQQGFAMFKE
jgi:putative pyrroloquinoline-quinone binding quinoprotein